MEEGGQLYVDTGINKKTLIKLQHVSIFQAPRAIQHHKQPITGERDIQ